MDIINSLITWRLKKRFHQIDLFIKYPIEVQEEWLFSMLSDAKNTEWGKKFNFDNITSVEQYKKIVPLQDYESLKSDIFRTQQGEKNILWPSEIKWFAKSSGTTSDKSKFIPVSDEAITECHFKGGKDMLSLYCNQVEDTKVFTGKAIMMGGSNQMNPNGNGSHSGDLSAIINENLPFWISRLRTPEKEIVLMDNWEEKIEIMSKVLIDENVTSISGVPSWTLLLLNKILQKTGASNLKEVWPNLELFMHGAVRFDPYKNQFDKIAPGLNYLETYNASEGFFGIQYERNVPDFLLMLDYGIYYEFIPMTIFGSENPKTIGLDEVKLNENYALVITTNAGLWRYVIGDTIKFTSLNPFRICITGRTKHFINAFGEELIIDNAEQAIKKACEKTGAIVNEYTAAPFYLTDKSAGHHDWLFEFEKLPDQLENFTFVLDNALKSINSDYEAKRFKDMILDLPKIKSVPSGTFYNWLKSKQKLGGQHKVPRLSNDRIYMDEILALI